MILKTKQQQPIELQFDPEWEFVPLVTFIKDKKQCTGRLISENTIAYISYPENRWFEFKTEFWSFSNGSEPKKEKNHSKPERVSWDDNWNQLPSVELEVEGKHCKGRLIGPDQVAYSGGKTFPIYFTVNSEHWQYVKGRIMYCKESRDYHSTFAGVGNIVKKSVLEVLQEYPVDAFSRIDTECYVYSNNTDRLSGLNAVYETLVSPAATKEQWIKTIMNAFEVGVSQAEIVLTPQSELETLPPIPCLEDLLKGGADKTEPGSVLDRIQVENHSLVYRLLYNDLNSGVFIESLGYHIIDAVKGLESKLEKAGITLSESDYDALILQG